MDARPFRPRGAENMPHLHERHKSMGNLSTMASSANAGFRGAAKRAAFGDVTNVSKPLGHSRDESKVLKAQITNVASNILSTIPVNKENGTYSKDAFNRPAQRPGSGFVGSTRTVTETKASEASGKLARMDSQQENRLYVKKDVQIKTSVSSSSSVDNRSLQPRHYKSQPQLKQQQPTLRRTQSRQLETVIANESDSEPTEEETAAALVLQEVTNAQTRAAYFDSLYLTTTEEASVDTNREEQVIELSANLPQISDEEAIVPVAYQENHVPAMSEPEEWDEEDDEDFDDQDQAYTTAHSFRSRDATTSGVTTVVLPRVTARVQRELEEAKIEVEQTRTQDDIEEELWDVSMVAEYGDEIFDYMRELEIKMLPNPHYMDIQTDIQWSMRSVLMDWLVQVHNRFGLLPETLFLTVNYIDRFLSSKVVSIGKLQLVGATAILVASKYEEINCPSLQEIVYMVDNGYTGDEILKAERFMLSMLGFELGWPGPMSFLRRVSKADDYDLETRTLAKYFLELTIMDERFVASPPSFLAAGAHCLSRFILNKGDWSKAHVHYSGYTWSQLRPLVTMMLECCDRPHLHHAAVFEKYAERRFKEASLLVQSALDQGFTLPGQTSFRQLSQDAFADASAEARYGSRAHPIPTEA
ncbi:cyclin-like protein [Mariannaea sp. PMI_226]|nr:cyclin-like protein [Mariannaea sp. PMI_226]